MNPGWTGYRPQALLESCSRAGIEAWVAPDARDSHWDGFLGRTPLGHFQQSSPWAVFKAGEGWRHHRVAWTSGDRVVGGFQLLWKRVGLARIGYVSKGPVANAEHAGLAARLLAEGVRQLGLHAVIVQAPDDSTGIGEALVEGGLRSNPLGVIEATYVVDLSGGRDQLLAGMHNSLRKGLVKARKQPVAVREGAERDLPRFFELMSATCRRQGTHPNPGSVSALQRLWKSFGGADALRLTLASAGDDDFAGVLCLAFGDRVSLWKKGWDGTRGPWRVNELLCFEAMEWAVARGYRRFDLCGFDRAGAERWLGGHRDIEAQDSRDRFHLRLGGEPRLLPRALLLIPNRALRFIYRWSVLRWERVRQRRRS